MPDLSTVGNMLPTKTPMVYDYKNIGTAAGTTTVSSEPCILHSLTVTQRAASGAIVIYDSVGTSALVVGSIVLGTQTFSDPVASYVFDVRTTAALSVSNSANVGVVVSFGK